MNDDYYRTSPDNPCYHCEFCDNCLLQALDMESECPEYQETVKEMGVSNER